MKSKCFACALVAGLAMSAVAAAEPGAKQAGGGVAVDQGMLLRDDVTQLTKGQVPGRATYNVATRQMTVHSYPSGGHVDVNPGVRGPVQNLLWSSIDPTGFYSNRVGASGGPLAETFDWGVLCGDPMTDTHTISQFTFSYATADPDGGEYAVDVSVYWGFDPLCPADPDGTVAGFNCLAANAVAFEIIDLPGSVPEGNTWIITIDLTGIEFTMPAGEFGYSFSNWVGFTNAGPTLTAENQIAAPGTDNVFDYYPGAPQAQPIIGSFWFGGTPYAQFYFELYSTTSSCGISDLGSCCLGDMSCVVVNEADCTTQGGTFALGVACGGPFHCFPAPANDECAGATAVPAGDLATGITVQYDLRGATDSPEPDAGCVPAAPQGTDVWFSWDAPCSGDMVLTTCLLNTSDDLIAVYSGNDCSTLIEVGCDDDGCGVIGGQSQISFSASAGTTYWFRMGTWNGTGADPVAPVNFFTLSSANCTGGPAFCDADWCQDGSVGVPDIFCFLSDWFALDPAARNYGGTPGVPAIFAFLSEWFSTGQGPCTP